MMIRWKMKLEEMVSDRQKFANLVKENAEPDLAAMGLDIISFNVAERGNRESCIDNIGHQRAERRERRQEMIQRLRIAVAE